MAGLNCGTVSAIAWPAIRDDLDAAVGVIDDETRTAMGELHASGYTPEHAEPPSSQVSRPQRWNRRPTSS
jgi:threonine dehydratase